jgi:VanZ family protein
VLTAWFSLVSVPPGASLFPHVDKLQHFLSYLVTSSLICLAGVWRPGRGSGLFGTQRRRLALASALIAGAGVIELVQLGVGREAEFADWAAGGAGIVLAFAGAERLRRRAS